MSRVKKVKQLGQVLRWARCLLKHVWQKLWPQAVTKGSASKLIHIGHCKSPSVKPIPWPSPPSLVICLRPFVGSRASCSILMPGLRVRTWLLGRPKRRGIDGGLQVCRLATFSSKETESGLPAHHGMAWPRVCPKDVKSYDVRRGRPGAC